MLRANAFGVNRTSFSSFRESVVTRVEVFVLREVAEFRGELAIKAEESLLVSGEGLRVEFSKGA
jgi:hypothetical protein